MRRSANTGGESQFRLFALEAGLRHAVVGAHITEIGFELGDHDEEGFWSTSYAAPDGGGVSWCSGASRVRNRPRFP